MSYGRNHEDGACDKCQEKPSQWKIPYLYVDMDDKSHKDLGNGYRQYYLCDDCKTVEEKILVAQGKGYWNNKWIEINELA